MAIFHFAVQTISRGAGRSAVAAWAYRAAVRMRDERTGLVHDYRARTGMRDVGVVGWSGDAAGLMIAAEARERHPRAVVMREIVAALPRELDHHQRRRLVEAFAAGLVERHGVAVAWAIHNRGAGSRDNPHAHLMVTTRRVEPGRRSLGAKARDLDTWPSGRQHIEAWRADWAATANRALEAAGRPERIDHRSLKRRGVQREPDEQLGPAAAAMERRGQRTVKGDGNRRRRRRQRERAALAAEASAIADAITVLERTAAPPRTMALVDQAIASLPQRRAAALVDAIDAAGAWGEHGALILATRIRRCGRPMTRLAIMGAREIGGTFTDVLLSELIEPEQPRQRVR